MKKKIGQGLIALPFVSIFALAMAAHGVSFSLFSFGLAGLIIGSVILGVRLSS